MPQVRWRDAGSVTVRLRTEKVSEAITVHPAHEELAVEEVAIGRELAAGEMVEPRMEGDTTITPVIEETPVVVMRRVLTKEVRLAKRRVEGTNTVEATVRRTVVETDAGNLAGRVHRRGTQPAKGIPSEEGTDSSVS